MAATAMARGVTGTGLGTVDRTEVIPVVKEELSDQPATAADLAGLKDRTVDGHETAEQPVVQKTARLIEELRVGKTLVQRTELVTDTVRCTWVEIDHILRITATGAFDADDYRSDFSIRFVTQEGRWEG
jgi:stress response protein YsnF